MRTLVEDISFAVRTLLRSPGFTVPAVGMLALAICATTVIFAIVHGVLLRPLPSPGLQQLHVVRGAIPSVGSDDVPLAPAEVLDLAARPEFEAVTGYAVNDRTLTGRGEPRRVTVTATVGDFAGVFGLRPHLGHFHRPEQSVDGPHTTVVLSHGLWQQLTGGDRGIIGQSLELNGVAYEVSGVMTPDFRFPRNTDVWIPFQFSGRFAGPQGRGIWNMTAVVRATAGTGPSLLAEQLAAEAERWRQQHAPGSETGKLLVATTLPEYLAGPLRPVLLVLAMAVLFVLLIACVNVASLQLVRASNRARELAISAALGAGGGRLARQVAIESVLVAGAGGSLGIIASVHALDLFARWGPAQHLHLTTLAPHSSVVAVAIVLALSSSLVFGIVPALRAGRTAPWEVLSTASRSASGGRHQHRLLRLSIATQAALAFVLLVGAGLMVRTLSQLLAVHPGFHSDNVTTAQIAVPGFRYDSGDRIVAFFEEYMERVSAIPGVEHVGIVWGLPFTDQTDSSPFRITGEAESESHQAATHIVGGGYFQAMGIPLLNGRVFAGTEREGEPIVAVVDRTFAERFFPGEDPVGRQLESGFFGFEPTTIIGVVERVHQAELGALAEPVIYYSHRHQSWWPWRSVVVRSQVPHGALTSALRAALSAMDPDVPLHDVQTMGARVSRSIAPRRLALLTLSVFGIIAIVLGSLGVYGVMRYTTVMRQREYGIRIALGAAPRHLFMMIVRQGMAPILVGIAMGVLGAWSLARGMSAVLYGVKPLDPAAWVGAALLLGAAALLACGIPAARAVAADPLTSLRNE